MSTLTKSRIAALICLLYIAWPALHRVVVASYATNAWQLGGFAMYATPPARTRVSVFEKRGSEKTLFQGGLPSALVEKQRLYGIRRSVLGSLLPPAALADAYFQVLPDVDHIEVVITREMLSAATARIEGRDIIYQYDRRPARLSRVRGPSTPPAP